MSRWPVVFAGYVKAQLAVFGLNLPDKWASPVWPRGQWTGVVYFNLPGFPHRLHSDAAAGARRREGIGEDEQHHGGDHVGAILTFLVVGGMLVKPANWTPFAPSGFSGVITGGAIVFFTYIGLRFGFNRGGGIAQSAKRLALRHHHVADCLHRALYRRGRRAVCLALMKYTTLFPAEAADAPVAYRDEVSRVHPLSSVE